MFQGARMKPYGDLVFERVVPSQFLVREAPSVTWCRLSSVSPRRRREQHRVFEDVRELLGAVLHLQHLLAVDGVVPVRYRQGGVDRLDGHLELRGHGDVLRGDADAVVDVVHRALARTTQVEHFEVLEVFVVGPVRFDALLRRHVFHHYEGVQESVQHARAQLAQLTADVEARHGVCRMKQHRFGGGIRRGLIACGRAREMQRVSARRRKFHLKRKTICTVYRKGGMLPVRVLRRHANRGIPWSVGVRSK